MRVLIVGAGIAGLATARSLGQVGIGCDIVERAQDWTRDGTGIYLPANAIRAMRLLGLDVNAGNLGTVIPRQRFLDHRGRLLMDVDLADVWGSEDRCFAMPRAALHDVLREGLAESIRMGTMVEAARTLEDEVEVSFDDGTTGHYDLVVAADGIHSSTRGLVLGSDDDPVRPVGQAAWRFVAECPAQVSTWSVMLGRGSTFLMIPIGFGRVYCYADIAAGTADDADLASHFATYAEPVGEVLASLESAQVHRSIIEEVVLQAWVFGRVLLVGDAAHATSPNMAQGAAMAIEDAIILARCLRDGQDVDAGLVRFEQQRRARTDWVRDQTHRRDQTRNLPAVLRNAALRVAGQRIFRSNYASLLPPP